MPRTGRFEQQIFLASWFWGLQATRVGLFQRLWEKMCSVLISLILMVYWRSLAFLGLQTQHCGLHLLVYTVVSCVHLFMRHSLCKGTSHFGLGTYSTPVSEKAKAPHSSTLAGRIPWMEEPGGLQSMGSRRVGHDWVTSLSLFTFMHWRRKWQPTPVFLPGESQGRGNLVGCHLWGRTESNTTEAT